MIDGENVFDQQVKKNDLRTNVSIQKISTDKRDEYTTDYLLDHNYFKNYYKMIAAIDLSKQQALDDDLKAIQKVNFTWNLTRNGNTTIFFITEKAKETILDFSKGTVRVLKTYFTLI